MDPLVKVLDETNHECVLIQSGQHYDFEMAEVFFHDLELRQPDFRFEIEHDSHGKQIATMLICYENLLRKTKPDLVLALGDTNTVVAASLSTIKQQIPFGHVEAGLRSFDLLMPEEINRRIADMCAAVNFAPSEVAALNLLYEGISPSKVFITGNPGIDSVLKHLRRAKKTSKVFERLGISDEESFIILTVHRPKNVDIAKNLKNLVKAIRKIDEKIVFPIHPRSKAALVNYGLLGQLESLENLIVCRPLGYLDFVLLLSRAALIMTDSGGLQEEALTLRIPCVTLRENTERPETVDIGANVLTGCHPSLIIKNVNFMLENNKFIRKKLESVSNPYGDGQAAEKIRVKIDFLWETSGLKYESRNFLAEPVSTKKFEISRINCETSINELETKTGQEISLIYDERGKPHFPRSKEILKKGWMVRLLFPGKK